MKRLFILLTVLVLIPSAAALADLEDWLLYEGQEFTIRYPEYMQVYGVPEEETGWNMDVLEEPDGTGEDGKPQILLAVIRADAADWTQWQETGFPDTWGQIEPMTRVEVDEPSVIPESDMRTHYLLYQSMDGKWMKKVIILETPVFEDPDYVIISRYPSYDDGNYENILDWMIGFMTFPEKYADGTNGNEGPVNGVTGGDDGFTFWLSREFYPKLVYEAYPVKVDADGPFMWLYTDTEVTDLVVEKVEWDDETFTVTAVTPVYSIDMLDPTYALCIRAYIPEMLPNLRIRATSFDGEEGCWYISESGEDGSLLLIPEEDLLP